MDNKEAEIKRVIENYLQARRAFFELEKKYLNELSGNDNIIGRIGEYIAIKYLEGEGRMSHKHDYRSTKGSDLKTTDGLVSVKMMTSENKNGKGARLTEPWDEQDFILLDQNYRIASIGHLHHKDFQRYLKEIPGRSKNPNINKRMLKQGGLFDRYGVVVKDGLTEIISS